MKILSTGEFLGNRLKYLELLGTVRLLKPDVLIITGDMFPAISKKDDLESQLSFIDDYVYYLEQYSKYCQYILYIAGESESILTHNKLEEILVNKKLKMIHSLNDKNFKFKNYHFIGLPYVRNSNILLKDWVRVDNNHICENNCEGIYTDNNTLKDLNDSTEFIANKLNINNIIREKLLACDKKEDESYILVSHYLTPIDLRDKNLKYVLGLNIYINEFKYIFCGHNTEIIYDYNRWFFKNKNTKIFSASQIQEILCYCYIVDNKVTEYLYHPLEYNQNFILSNVLNYKNIIENEEIQLNGLGDSIAKFLHSGIVGKVVETITGKDAPCLPCKRRQEKLNNLFNYNN